MIDTILISVFTICLIIMIVSFTFLILLTAIGYILEIIADIIVELKKIKGEIE